MTYPRTDTTPFGDESVFKTITPEEAADWLQELEDEGLLTVKEADLNPEDPRMGRAQFLLTPIEDDAILRERLEDVELDYYNSDSAPPHFRHAALPPK